MEPNTRQVKVSVRNLVEFILRSGSLDNRQGKREPEAMQEGSRLHRKLQKQAGPGYQAEVAMSEVTAVSYEGREYEICVEGRADGVITEEDGSVTIDEIKCVYRELSGIEEPVGVHRAQAMCYAYMISVKQALAAVGLRITYCNIESENVKYFEEQYTAQQLYDWYQELLKQYCKWADWQYEWRLKRDASIRNIEFPFPYREGQKELAAGVYRTILRSKKLFLEAPTGVGKTISTVFPAVKAMGEGLAEKIFYLTAKTITRTVAEEAFRLLLSRGLAFKLVTLTAKEKICVLEKPECNPSACERANGHFDRVNDAVFDMLLHEEGITRELILQYAEKHKVCPFEMCLDVTTWADGIICDYNYVFDPNVYLRRFFTAEKKQDYVFLVDEAHNLVDRAREMYSAVLNKQDFLTVKRLVKAAGGTHSGTLIKRLDACNALLLAMKRECENYVIRESAGDLALKLLHLMSEYEEYLEEMREPEGKEEILNLYFAVRQFLMIHELLDEKYLIYTDYNEQDEFRITLASMDPSTNLKRCLDKGRSAVFFSATLLPIQYYREQLGGEEEDYAVYAPTPFKTENRLLMIGKDVSTRYTRRNSSEYDKILDYIVRFTGMRTGNYLVFFPSYQMMNQLAELAGERLSGLRMQKSSMTESEREEFLAYFCEEPDKTRIGFCVMGGIFGEGIDLKDDRLIGAVIVGTGLPMVCTEREIYRGYYEEHKGKGFEYAYLYQGMNKVLQSAGRVIRTVTDRGAILLLDERFLQPQYQNIFPREWFPHYVVNRDSMETRLSRFWGGTEE
ncbi:MAG: ATP-dependent DNA helicase [Lachnospiraceae bacterium]|nr:ATP-dependent DNA helicase [Lachnospiraceae bacterium]